MHYFLLKLKKILGTGHSPLPVPHPLPIRPHSQFLDPPLDGTTTACRWRRILIEDKFVGVIEDYLNQRAIWRRHVTSDRKRWSDMATVCALVSVASLY